MAAIVRGDLMPDGRPERPRPIKEIANDSRLALDPSRKEHHLEDIVQDRDDGSGTEEKNNGQAIEPVYRTGDPKRD